MDASRCQSIVDAAHDTLPWRLFSLGFPGPRPLPPARKFFLANIMKLIDDRGEGGHFVRISERWRQPINSARSPTPMVEYRTIKRNGKSKVIRIENGSPRPKLSRSSNGKEKKWSAREFLREKYGEEAFNPDGSIKLAYLDYAIYEAERDHHITLQKRLERTRRLREAQVRRQVKKLDEEEERKHRDETYIHAHESHSRTGKEEEVEGHEMKLPNYEGGPSTKLTTADRHKLPASAFAEPGRRAYPIPSKEQLEYYLGWSPEKARKGAERHAINALARAQQHGTPEEKREIRRKIHENVPEVDGAVMKKGFKPTEMTVIHVKGHEQPAYYVPPHTSHSRDGAVEHVEGHMVEAHEVDGYEEEMNRPR